MAIDDYYSANTYTRQLIHREYPIGRFDFVFPVHGACVNARERYAVTQLRAVRAFVYRISPGTEQTGKRPPEPLGCKQIPPCSNTIWRPNLYKKKWLANVTCRRYAGSGIRPYEATRAVHVGPSRCCRQRRASTVNGRYYWPTFRHKRRGV